uniref:Uncharacterized protein n=1 Tax=Arundo donax TaxID=35708 RepID=A0A0A9Q5D4_ARUDO
MSSDRNQFSKIQKLREATF